jgi:hypothetical protein
MMQEHSAQAMLEQLFHSLVGSPVAEIMAALHLLICEMQQARSKLSSVMRR